MRPGTVFNLNVNAKFLMRTRAIDFAPDPMRCTPSRAAGLWPNFDGILLFYSMAGRNAV